MNVANVANVACDIFGTPKAATFRRINCGVKSASF